VVALTASGLACANDDALGAWRQYATQSIKPNFEWAATDVPANAVEPTVFNAAMLARQQALPNVKFFDLDSRGVFKLSLAQTRLGDGARGERDALAASNTAALTSGFGIERTLIAPSVSGRFGEGTVSGAVVFAHQQFASWGMGASLNDAAINAQYNERSSGSGVRLQYERPLSERFNVSVAYQSKVNMDAFQAYRGVYSDPGDFDMPSITSVGFGWRASDRSTFGLGYSRLGYSEINTFTSSSLPTRLLALLGDGTSPVFAWRDLDVISASWQWRPTQRDELTVRYTTQQQPEPTSRLLFNALRDEFTDNNLALDYRHDFKRMGSLRLSASYASAQYFLGNLSYDNRDATGDQVEVEAMWSLAF
jgi:hypothetical protein